MKCPNCGAEITGNNKTCECCGSQLSYEMIKEQEQINKQGCPKCGSTNITFSREKQGEVKKKKKNTVVRKTVGLCKDCGYTWSPEEKSSSGKSNKWLWILGWIFIFPVPLTIILFRNKDMKNGLKYGLIAAAWVIYFIIAAGASDKKEDDSPDATTESIEAETTEPNKTVEIESDVELNELQNLFVNIGELTTRDDVFSYVNEKGYNVTWFQGDYHNATSCYLGNSPKSTSKRSRDREGAYIDIEFDNEGNITRAGYSAEKTATYFDDFELKYENGSFNYNGNDYDDGKTAMKLYLSDNNITNEEAVNEENEDVGDRYDIEKFITDLNASGKVNLVFVEDFEPSNKEDYYHYRTEFRLNSFSDDLGKSYTYDDKIVDIILSEEGEIERIYMCGTYEQCENIVRYSAPLLDPTVTESELQAVIDDLTESKASSGLYMENIVITMEKLNEDAYSLMLKSSAYN